MAGYTNVLSFLLVIVFLTTLKVDARASKFSRFIPQVDEQQPLKPSSETKNYNGYHFENHQSDIPPEEFLENIKKDSPESDENSYVTEPQGRYKEKDSNDFYYPNKGAMHKTDASTNDEYALSTEEREFFNKKEANKKEAMMNGYNGYNNDHEDVPAQGMSDTRTLENGKYYYNPMDVKGKRGSEKYNNEGYYGNREYISKSDEFLPFENFEVNPQNQGGFNP